MGDQGRKGDKQLLWGGELRGSPGAQRGKALRRLALPPGEESKERTGTLWICFHVMCDVIHPLPCLGLCFYF